MHATRATLPVSVAGGGIGVLAARIDEMVMHDALDLVIEWKTAREPRLNISASLPVKRTEP